MNDNSIKKNQRIKFGFQEKLLYNWDIKIDSIPEKFNWISLKENKMSLNWDQIDFECWIE